MMHKYLRVWLTLGMILLLMTGVIFAKTKAEKFFQEGQAAEAKHDWDKALDFYIQALDLKPSEQQYIIAMRRARFQDGQMHINLGQKLRTDGKLEQAMAEFQKALIADPASPIAIQEIKRTQEMIEGQKKQPVAEDEKGLTPAERERRASDQRINSLETPPELKPVLRTIGPLKMNNQPPKVLFETVGKLAGVNVLFDAQYTPPSRGFNVELAASTPEQAFDYLAVLTHTFWKPVTSNAIFVTEDNPTKHRDYDDEVVKTFYITNATSVQEFQEIATAIRTVAEIRRVFTYNAQKALIIRGPVDAVELAEKLVHDLDKPKSEVIVDVMIMQTNSDRSRSLAATIASAGTAGLNVPIAFTPTTGQFAVTSSTTTSSTTGTTTTGTTTTPSTGTTGTTTGTPTTPTGAVTLGQLGHLSINDWSTSLPGAILQFMMSDSRTKITNSPQLRASDGQKAELKIGQRYPYATGSFQPGVGTVGVSPLVSTQFNYADVGVNLVITPQVHSSKELTLHVEVEVSNIAQLINLGGISQPVIAQNKSTADIRLRDGEVNILGGLSQLSDSHTLAGLPGLTDIPVLGGVLFGSTTTDKQNNQLMIALIPHILRTPDYSPENLRGIYAGSGETTIKLNYAPKPEPSAPPQPEAPKGTAPQTPGAIPPTVTPSPTAPPPTAPPPTAPAPTAPGQPPVAPPAAPPPAPTARGQARLTFAPAAVQATVSNPVTVTVQLENAADLFSASPIKIKFDPSQLRLNEVTPGDLFTRDGAKITSAKDIRNDSGEATLTVSRLPGTQGISGTGGVMVLNFVAVGKGSSTISVVESGLKNSQGQPLGAASSELTVKVQ